MFGITRRTQDPMLDLLYNLERRMGRSFTEPFAGFEWPLPTLTTAAWTPVVDIIEEADAIRIVAELPGVKPEDVKISLEGLLTISGKKEQVAEEKAEKVHRYERIYGAFERSFTIPATVDVERIKAQYDVGVLTLTLPKSEKAKPRQVEIEVGKGAQVLKA